MNCDLEMKVKSHLLKLDYFFSFVCFSPSRERLFRALANESAALMRISFYIPTLIIAASHVRLIKI